jgi:HSF-type DNA-binding
MITLTHVERECARLGKPENEESIGWVLDGKAFTVLNMKQFCETWLPVFFGQSKFSSFTRKLYRWGFRKINVASIPNRSAYPENALFFGNECFQRDDKALLASMESVTAAKTRCSAAADALKQAWMPPEESPSVQEETKPQAAQLVAQPASRNISYQVEHSNSTATSRENMATLLQEAANLAALRSLITSSSQVGLTNYQPPIQSSLLDDSLRRLLMLPQNPQALQLDTNQLLQQLALSAALLGASGSASQAQSQIPTQTQLLPQDLALLARSINSNISTTQTNQMIQRPLQRWPSEVRRPTTSLQPPVIQNAAEQERLRGVIEAFLRYCQSIQQQQSSALNPSLDQTFPPRGPPH